MPKKTYTQIASITLAASSNSVTFVSIPQNFRDLVLVVAGTLNSGTQNPRVQLNADTGNNYSNVWMGGSGSSATSGTNSSVDYNFGGVIFTAQSNDILQIMDYSATDKHKTTLTRGNAASSTSGQATSAWAGRWANTAAVTSIRFYLNAETFAAGSTFTLYGIEA
jgi:hypothetical protein